MQICVDGPISPRICSVRNIVVIVRTYILYIDRRFGKIRFVWVITKMTHAFSYIYCYWFSTSQTLNPKLVLVPRHRGVRVGLREQHWPGWHFPNRNEISWFRFGFAKPSTQPVDHKIRISWFRSCATLARHHWRCVASHQCTPARTYVPRHTLWGYFG